MVTDTICLSPEEAINFYKAFERIAAINYVTIDKVHFDEKASKYLYVTISAYGASSFYSIGFYQQLLFPLNRNQ